MRTEVFIPAPPWFQFWPSFRRTGRRLPVCAKDVAAKAVQVGATGTIIVCRTGNWRRFAESRWPPTAPMKAPRRFVRPKADRAARSQVRSRS